MKSIGWSPTKESDMYGKEIIKQALPWKWRRRLRERLVSMEITHVSGPKRIQLRSNQAAVTCIVRNGQFYIERFIKYYFSKGFRHLIFLDNGSTDLTVPIARSFSNVSVYASKLPIEAHQALFKKRLPQIAIEGGWCLDADIDEFFDYPRSNVVSLPLFLEYLNSKRYSAVITQMLDMFGDRAISASVAHSEEEDGEDEFHHLFPYYNLSGVTKVDYETSQLAMEFGSHNCVPPGVNQLYWGGIRKTLSGNEYLLTKHSLFSLTAGSELFPHVHFIDKARLADVCGVLFHYKLTSNALSIALQNMDRFPGNGKLYADFIEYLKRTPTSQAQQIAATRLKDVDDLVAAKFLFMSDEYSRYVEGTSTERTTAYVTS